MNTRTWHAVMLAKLNAATATILLPTTKGQTALGPCEPQAVASLPLIERPARIDSNHAGDPAHGE